MDALALVLSALSLIVAVVGTILANKRSHEALNASQKAATDARWIALQEAVQRLIGFEPVAEPIKDRLANLRIAAIALVDQLETWEGLDAHMNYKARSGSSGHFNADNSRNLLDLIDLLAEARTMLNKAGHSLTMAPE